MSQELPAAEAVADRLTAAIDFAQQGGDLTLDHFLAADLAVEHKSDNSPVTVADRDAESLIRDRINKSFPEDAVLGEEFGSTEGTTPFQWVIDPIDGTKSFICGVPLYATLIGVLYQKQPVIGVIYIPALQELAYASHQGGCFYRSRGGPLSPARVSDVGELKESVVLTSEVRSFSEARQPPASAVMEALERSCRFARTWGDAYGYLLVATGRAEVMIDPVVSLWDAAALQPVIEEAGGFFGDWQGVATVHHEEALATNGRVTSEVLAVTSPFARRD